MQKTHRRHTWSIIPKRMQTCGRGIRGYRDLKHTMSSDATASAHLRWHRSAGLLKRAVLGYGGAGKPVNMLQ